METKVDTKTGTVTITLDATRDGDLSRSGKSYLVETTRGFVVLPELDANGDTYKLMVNFIRMK